MKRLAVLLAGGALMLAASSATAVTLDASLDRQVAIAPSYPGENSLQNELDQMFGGKLNAATDQVGIGMYKVSTPGSSTITPQFKFEWTGNSATQRAGIFSWNGTSTVEYLLFQGGNNPGDIANVIWEGKNKGHILTIAKPGFQTTVTAFEGIDRDFFGFFFQPALGSPIYYTLDALNPEGEARVLAFDGSAAGIPNGGMLFAYEDGNDFDYQDGGIFVESITPVPEPGTMLLFGAGFLGFAIYGKRRRNA